MENNESKEGKELAFYRVFFRFTLPGMAFIMLVGTVCSSRIPIKYTILYGIGFVIMIVAAYIWAKWILKSPERIKWASRNWWRSNRK